jgi:hypothetical protein
MLDLKEVWVRSCGSRPAQPPRFVSISAICEVLGPNNFQRIRNYVPIEFLMPSKHFRHSGSVRLLEPFLAVVVAPEPFYSSIAEP